MAKKPMKREWVVLQRAIQKVYNRKNNPPIRGLEVSQVEKNRSILDKVAQQLKEQGK